MKERQAIPTTDEALTELVRTLSLAAFHKPFTHRARYNHRLRAVAGRYLLTSHDLEFSFLHADCHGLDDLTGTVLHELCHYHLHLAGGGYRHRDREFKTLLTAVGGSRYARPVVQKTLPKRRYVYSCASCLQRYERQRKMDTQRFVCGRCRGQLQLETDTQRRM